MTRREKTEEEQYRQYFESVKSDINISDEKDKNEVFMKGYLMEKVDWSFPLNFYEDGCLFFFVHDSTTI
jgi:hypothetical protein